MDDRTIIEHARKHTLQDPNLSVYMVKDLQVTKDADLVDLAWAYYQENVCSSEAEALLDDLVKYLDEHPR